MTRSRAEFEITPTALVAALESGAALQIVDVRAPERLGAGKIETLPTVPFINIPGSRLQAMDTLVGTLINPALPIVTG